MVGTAPGPFFVFKTGQEDVIRPSKLRLKAEMEYIGVMSALGHRGRSVWNNAFCDGQQDGILASLLNANPAGHQNVPSIARVAAGAFEFLFLIQLFDDPDRYGAFSFFDRRFNAILSAKIYSWFWPKIAAALVSKYN
jgi:hypothetical protein